ncbi:MAG TPA: response regulator [Verrucomicrobiae bacterium]|nr:response regulator [Verrucomicrobiae bacterium]
MNGHEDLTRSTRKLQLLVVDDEPNVCECLKLILALDGHDVATANSGRDGIELFRSRRFDVVCTDYSMPGMRGDEFAAGIKALRPDQPIVMISGLAGTLEKPAGVDYILSKPFFPNDLRLALRAVMQSTGRTERHAFDSVCAADQPESGEEFGMSV